MKFQVSEGEKYQKVMEVEIPAEEMELPIKLACKRLAQKVNIPGFRKGKAPRAILENYVGMEAILEEACEEVVPKAYLDGLKETGVEPCARPQIEMLNMTAGEPLRFKAIITVKPEVKLGQYRELPVTRRIVEVTEEDIDHDLEHQRERLAKLVDAEEGAAAQNGDTVTIDFKGMKDGVAFEGGTAENYPLELGSHSFIPGFEEQLVGCKAGEEKAINVTFPEEYQEKSLAGQPVVFEVRVNSIKKKVVPELDQAFVEEVSETAENMEQLREEIKKRLTEQSMSMADANTRDAAVVEAVEKAEIDIPPVMIEQQLDQLIDDMRQRLQMQGISLEQYLEYTAGDMETLRENYRSRAEFTVKRDLVMEAIAKAEDFPVSQEEIDEQITAMSTQYWQPVEKIREALERNNSMEDLIFHIKMQKAANLVYEQAVITDEIIDREELKKKAEARARMEQRLQEMAENEDAAESEIVMEAPAEESGEVVEAEVKEAE